MRVCSGRPLQLVERVRPDAHRERERERRPAEQRPVHPRRERRADRDVREMPERVRRMEERDVVAPAARTQRVERRPRPCRGHARRPQTTMPPPTLSRRACDVGEAGLAPRVEEARLRPVAPEVADARAEEAADLAPARRDDGSRRRQPDSHVELPERPPDAARQAELEHRHRPAGPHDAGELAQRRGHVVDVAQEIRERERVELRVGERQLLGASLAQLDPVAQPGVLDALAPGREHLGALVDPDDRAGRPARDELDRHGRRSRRDVEHALARRAGSGRRGTRASAGPGRTRAAGRSGRTSGRAARTARARGACARGLHGPILAA